MKPMSRSLVEPLGDVDPADRRTTSEPPQRFVERIFGPNKEGEIVPLTPDEAMAVLLDSSLTRRERAAEALATFAAWLRARFTPKSTLFPRRGGLLIVESTFTDAVEAATFKAQFDELADNVLWVRPGVDGLTYRDRFGNEMQLYRRRGLIASPYEMRKPQPESSEGEAES